jgi:hypothetical protein
MPVAPSCLVTICGCIQPPQHGPRPCCSVTLHLCGHGGMQVPGLAENRPSVMRGDAVYVWRADGSDGRTEYQGYAHFIERDGVSGMRARMVCVCM